MTAAVCGSTSIRRADGDGAEVEWAGDGGGDDLDPERCALIRAGQVGLAGQLVRFAAVARRSPASGRSGFPGRTVRVRPGVRGRA